MRSYGYAESELTGREPVADRMVERVSIPDTYRIPDFRAVRDQGSRPICVSIALVDLLEWDLRNRGTRCRLKESIFMDLDGSASKGGMQPLSAFQLLVDGKVEGLPRKYSVYATIKSPEAAKRCIIQYGPVLVGLPVKSDDDTFWRGYSKRSSGHAVLLVGYTEDSFLLKNSWGYSYANGGFIDFPVEDYECVREAWSLVM